ncbi:hypothetical protein ACFZBU_03550 [Embleya sp. NPDC008237]|uniref:hypothetical protein n=1 Tax=Embleya sp. NPDC008237 TaxID=3363978 RepID=UPI0036E56DD6
MWAQGRVRTTAETPTDPAADLDAAVVVYREVVGPGTCDLAEAVRIVAEYRDVCGADGGYHARNPHLIGEAIERLR